MAFAASSCFQDSITSLPAVRHWLSPYNPRSTLYIFPLDIIQPGTTVLKEGGSVLGDDMATLRTCAHGSARPKVSSCL